MASSKPAPKKTAAPKRRANPKSAARSPAEAKLLHQLQAASFPADAEKKYSKRTLNDSQRYLYMSKLPEAPSLRKFDIPKHKLPQFLPCEPFESLYNPNKDEWHGHEPGELDVSDVLDTLTYAALNGKLNSRTWVRTVFRTREAWAYFVGELAAYETCIRIRGPWWWALARLCEHKNNEEGFSTADEMANVVHDHATDTGQFELLGA